jgi:ribonuclease HI
VHTERQIDLLAVRRVNGMIVKTVAFELSITWEGFTEEFAEQDEWARRAAQAGLKWESTLERRAVAKRFKYETEMMTTIPREWEARLFTCEVGARGLVTSRVAEQLTNLARVVMGERGLGSAARKEGARLAADVSEKAIVGSYIVWSRRFGEWEYDGPANDRRGTEELGVRVLDGMRQKQAAATEERDAGVKDEWTKQDVEDDEEEACRAERTTNDAWKEGLRQAREEAESRPGVVIYTDGSFVGKRSGWGFVAVHREEDGTTRVVKSACGPVVVEDPEAGTDGDRWSGCQFHSNNAGEIAAIVAALQWWVSETRGDEAVAVCPDSLWAVGATKAGRARFHRGAARRAAELAARAQVTWGWVKGHEDHQWNEEADRLANKGRTNGAEVAKAAEADAETETGGPAAEKRQRSGRAQRGEEVRGYRWVVREEELAEVGPAIVRKVKAGTIGRDEQGRRVLETAYWKKSSFGRRNARGFSLQFMDKRTRMKLAGRTYVELDLAGAHPAMLLWAAEEATAGKIAVPLLRRLVHDPEELYRTVRDETGLERDGAKKLLLAVVNGANARKGCEHAGGKWSAAGTLETFGSEMRRVRRGMTKWRPDIATEVRERGGASLSRWELEVKTTYFAMTEREDRVMSAVEEAVTQRGLDVGARTGDGLIITPRCTSTTERSVTQLIDDIVTDVQPKVSGARVRLTMKTLDGQKVTEWPWPTGHGERA